MAKSRITVSLDDETVEALTKIAQEHGLSTPMRINISSAIQRVTAEYKRRVLVDTRSEYITTRQG